MIQTIIAAVKGKHVLTLIYGGLHRTIEPHAVGRTKAGHDVVRCYQIWGQHHTGQHDWDLLTVSKISNLQSTGHIFPGPRDKYKRGDKAMAHIYAEL